MGAYEREFRNGLALQGRRRFIVAFTGLANLFDVTKDGRGLLSMGDLRPDLVVWAPGGARERQLAWLDYPRSLNLSRDGRTVVFSEAGQGGGPESAAVYARGIDGSPAVRLGEGFALDLSADGRFVVALARSRGQPARELVAIPTGPGQARTLVSGELEYKDARWFPAGDKLLVVGRQPGLPWRLWVVAEGAPPRPATPEGYDAGIPSPEGRSWVARRIGDRALVLFASEGGEGRPLPGPPEAGRLVTWAPDGRSLLLVEPLIPGVKILRRDLTTGARTTIRELRPEDPAGVIPWGGTVNPSGDAFAALYVRASTALFLVRPLR